MTRNIPGSPDPGAPRGSVPRALALFCGTIAFVAASILGLVDGGQPVEVLARSGGIALGAAVVALVAGALGLAVLRDGVIPPDGEEAPAPGPRDAQTAAGALGMEAAKSGRAPGSLAEVRPGRETAALQGIGGGAGAPARVDPERVPPIPAGAASPGGAGPPPAGRPPGVARPATARSAVKVPAT